jgi:hypothetical protein
MATRLVQAELADGIAEFLNNQSLSLEFEAKREWAFLVDRDQLEDPTVCVVPDDVATSRVSRVTTKEVVVIDVSVRRRHEGNPADLPPKERCDRVGDFAQEIKDKLFDAESKIVTPSFTAVPIESDMTWLREDLVADRCMTLIITVSYSLLRALPVTDA